MLLVHRPRYDDWTLPKGKLEPGESHEQAALREVAEETGLECRLGPEIGSTAYLDRRDRPKTVRYWAMTEAGGAFAPHEEVDAACWLPVVDAAGLLTYDRDRTVLDTLRRVAPPPLLVVRHAAAGDRRKWKGPDAARPLSAKGRRQAEALVDVLGRYRVERIVSSPAVRCVQTVEPLARARDLEVAGAGGLAEGVSGPGGLELLRAMAGTATVLCTHGDVLEATLSEVAREDRLRLAGRLPSAKGSTWVLEAEDDRFVAARYLDAPPKT